MPSVSTVDAPVPSADPARQLAYDLDSVRDSVRNSAGDSERSRVEKPTASEVDLLIRMTLTANQPGLHLPPVRVSGRMRRTLGSYTPSKRQIAISSRLLAMGEQADIRQVVLHEVAHAIVHARFGEKTSAHGREFRTVCRELNIRPRRHVDVTTEKWQSQVRFLVKCGHCRALIVRKKRMRSVRCGCGLKVYPKSWRAVAPVGDDNSGEWVAL